MLRRIVVAERMFFYFCAVFMKKSGLILTLTLIGFLMGACAKGDRQPIGRLDRFAASFAKGDGADTIPAGMQPGVAALMAATGVSGTAASDFVRSYGGSEASIVFQPDVESLLGDIGDVEYSTGSLLRALAEKVPGMDLPTNIYGVITPYTQSIVMVDSVMLIGLNHYLGSDYAGYAGFGRHNAWLKRRGRIVTDMAEALIRSRFPAAEGAETTLLQRMLYDGAVTVVMAISMPGVPLSEILGIGDDDMRVILRNESGIWNRLVESGLLFSTDRRLADSLFNPSPASSAIDPSCPGRAVRLLAHHIVKSYVARNGIPDDWSVLLGEDFYKGQETLLQSGYRP